MDANKPSPRVLESISIVLPAHNEEENILEAIRQAMDAAESVSPEQEVVVVDDGSADRTAAITADLASRDSRIRLVRHERNRGYGAAVRSGIDAARMDWVLLTDADLQFDLAQLPEFARYTREASMVVGYRANRQDPLLRRINARGWNAIVDFLFHLSVRDVDAAFKLIRRNTLAGLDLVSTGATIDAELLAKATERGASLVELPVRHLPRVAGTASGANLRVIARAFSELFHVWWGMHHPAIQPLPAVTGKPAH
jgi:glycosyltransferase involved in cell wall biosynthesis